MYGLSSQAGLDYFNLATRHILDNDLRLQIRISELNHDRDDLNRKVGQCLQHILLSVFILFDRAWASTGKKSRAREVRIRRRKSGICEEGTV